MADHVEVRRGAYDDSVTLMQVSAVADRARRRARAQVAMATELNLDLLAGMGFAVAEELGPNDLLVAVRGARRRRAGGRAGGGRRGAGRRPPAPRPAGSATPRRHAPSARPRPPRTRTWR